MILEADVLRKCLNDYGKDMVGLLSEKQICLDGKKLKGVSPTSRGNSGFYIVNAWVAENRLCKTTSKYVSLQARIWISKKYISWESAESA